MTWPFLYYPGDALSDAELRSARLDGDLVEIGEAFMPADAVETRELRAGSLRALVGARLALTHESAAWVHGAIPEPPRRHCVQRCVAARPHHVTDRRLRYRDVRLPVADGVLIAGVVVSTPVRTFADLLRDRVLREDGDDGIVRALLAWRPQLLVETRAWLSAAGPVQFKRPARAYLDRLERERTPPVRTT
ncbi:SAM-dependent methyltransferase [Microbacterium sp. T2.11-28]|uniref:SAM-dependent methyltransferase n=1 Tax=Microbacterium sp. T2.11-28 TaxID=3041169 RepID=UPI002477379A|nr:SAM-dependent methyltransferase [Microbacterium sp. T2.11-28]CAI9385967.1 hypothetical protein MICABA_00094 [Microbacterium sp. T2.11-28]